MTAARFPVTANRVAAAFPLSANGFDPTRVLPWTVRAKTLTLQDIPCRPTLRMACRLPR